MIRMVRLKNYSIWLLISLLTGCATNQIEPQTNNVFKELYEGESETLYSTMLPPSSAQEAEARADKAMGEGEEDKALYLYVQSLGMDPENENVFYKIAEIYSKRGNQRQAGTAYSYALKINPENAAALEGLGLIVFKQKKQKAAKSLFERALESDPMKWRSLNGLGIIADLEGDHVKAQEHYNAALQVAPGSTKVLNNLAYSYYLQGNRSDAINLYRNILLYESVNSLAWANLGIVYTKEGMYREAIDAFNFVLNEAESFNMVGYLIMIDQQHLGSYTDIEKYELAEEYFNLAIGASPRYYKQAHDNLDRLRDLVEAM